MNVIIDKHKESLSLLETYKCTKGENWIDNTNWGSNDEPLNRWYGIECNNNNNNNNNDDDDNNVISIDLRRNNLVGDIISGLKDFLYHSCLQELWLSGNDLEGDISELQNILPHSLVILDLQVNRIQGDISKKFPDSLEQLYLQNNNLKNITRKGAEGLQGIKNAFHLDGNPWKRPPINVVNQEDPASMISWWNGIEESGEIFTSQLKVVFIGQAMAGKTSLMKRLQNRKNPLPDADDQGRTILLDIVPHEDEKKHITYWDFGGQKDYHPYYQLFLTMGALYIVVVDLVEFYLTTVESSSTTSFLSESGNCTSDSYKKANSNNVEKDSKIEQYVDRWVETLMFHLSMQQRNQENEQNIIGGKKVGIHVVGNWKEKDFLSRQQSQNKDGKIEEKEDFNEYNDDNKCNVRKNAMNKLKSYITNCIETKNKLYDSISLEILTSIDVNVADSNCKGMNELEQDIESIVNNTNPRQMENYQQLFPSVDNYIPAIWYDAVKMMQTLQNEKEDQHQKQIDLNQKDINIAEEQVINENGKRKIKLVLPDEENDEFMKSINQKTKKRFCSRHCISGIDLIDRWTEWLKKSTVDGKQRQINLLVYDALLQVLRLKEIDGTIIISWNTSSDAKFQQSYTNNNNITDNQFTMVDINHLNQGKERQVQNSVAYLDPIWIIKILKPLLDHRLSNSDKLPKLQNDLGCHIGRLMQSSNLPCQFDFNYMSKFWDIWRQGQIHKDFLLLPFIWGSQLNAYEKQLIDEIVQLLQQKFFLHMDPDTNYIHVPSRLSEKLDFKSFKDKMAIFSYHEKWTRYSYKYHTGLIDLVDHLIPRIICRHKENRVLISWRHGALVKWSQENDSKERHILLFTSKLGDEKVCRLNVFINGKDIQSNNCGKDTRMIEIHNYVTDVEYQLQNDKLVKDVMNFHRYKDYEEEQESGIETIFLFQKKYLGSHLLSSKDEYDVNINLIPKHKRKALIIDKMNESITKNDVIQVLQYLNFEITDYSNITTSTDLKKILTAYVKTELGENEINNDIDGGCFFCFIHSHGFENDNIVLNNKGEDSSFKLQMLIDVVSGDTHETKDDMEALTDISKFIFVDACRGGFDRYTDLDENEDEYDIYDDDDDDLKVVQLKKSNIYLLHATRPGLVSFNYKNVFEKLISEIFNNHHRHDIGEIISNMRKKYPSGYISIQDHLDTSPILI